MPLTRRQIYRRRRIVVFGTAVLVLGSAFYLPLTLLAPVRDIVATAEPYAAPTVVQPTLTFPAYGASGLGAVGYPGVLASAGATTPLPIASISKIVTALVVLEAKPLALGDAGPNVTFGPIDEQFYASQLADGGVVESVYSGQVISQRNIMTVMLMESANNYADSLANWAFGSAPAYVAAARAWLSREGLAHTTINDPTGVSPGNTSTVADLVELARRAEANPVVAEIVSTASADIPDIGTIHNRNELLGQDGVIGIKTGTLDEAGSCLLFAQQHVVGAQTVTILGVVLGGPDHDTIDAAIQSLLDQADAGFREVTLTTQGEEFARYESPWGTTAGAVAARDTSAAVWSASPVTLVPHLDDITLAKAGASVGELDFTIGSNVVTVPLVLSHSIDDPGAWWRLTNPTRLL
jgi:D-alanyl-D-alanine carboxypeptidase (penicillin-binding protein 5/6)